MSHSAPSAAAAIVNYDPKQPTLKSLVPWTNPSLMKVFFSFEFWFYSGVHMLVVFLSIIDVIPLLDVDWKAAGAFQYFTTFFLTFYNGNCYARYQKLYGACCEMMDGAMLFVREMTICFKDESTWKHRLQATKWLLAAVDLFFMGVCGNKLSMRGWSEVVKKGLLTKSEAQMLLRYPGPEVVPILTTWTMICVADGLEKPCFHEKKNPKWATCRTQKIAHLHNRLDRILIRLMTAYREISETMAQPIPFAYWHLMNLVFTLNFMLLAMILASFKHWLTIIPYCMALMTFMGLREVSNQLADPFGDDIVDFPLAKYLDYTFDHSVCLLTAFSSTDAYDRIRRQVEASPLFDDKQIRRHMRPQNLYNDNYVAHVDGVFIWEKDQPLSEAAQVYEKESLQDQLKYSLAGIPVGDYGHAEAYDQNDELINPVSIGENHKQWLERAEADADVLRTFPGQGEPRLRDRKLPGPPTKTQEQLGGGGPQGSAAQTSSDEDGVNTQRRKNSKPPSLEIDALEEGAVETNPQEQRARASRRSNASVQSRLFQWGFQNHGRHEHTGSERSFRMEDTSFELTQDASGQLRRRTGAGQTTADAARKADKSRSSQQPQERSTQKSNFDYASHTISVEPAARGRSSGARLQSSTATRNSSFERARQATSARERDDF